MIFRVRVFEEKLVVEGFIGRFWVVILGLFNLRMVSF